MSNKRILVLGAGVSGLSTAILLLKEGYHVDIWAKDLPPNTTSDVAGAFWLPYLCKPKDKVTRWSAFTMKYLEKYVSADLDSGCIKRQLFDVHEQPLSEPEWGEAVEHYTKLKPEELPEGYVDGFKVEIFVMDTSIYMNWLLRQFTLLGGKIEQREIGDIDEALDEQPIVVNCLGLGSRKIFADNKLFPVRGQILKIKPNGFDHVVAADSGPVGPAVIVPRTNDIVLGGTAQVNNWSLEVSAEDTASVLERVRVLAPGYFENVEIVSEAVGLRPGRETVRVELEKYKDRSVIHNYGHGGAGFTLSWGCANEVVGIIKNLSLE